MLYHQCRFRRGSERTVAWIETRGAKVGAQLELTTLDENGPRIVEHVSCAVLKEKALKLLPRLDRKSLSSIMKNIV